MSKRNSYEIIGKILYRVREKEATYAELERNLSTGHRTIKTNCKLLERLGQVKIKRNEKHPANGREAYTVSLTEEGLKSSKNFEKKNNYESKP